MSATTGVPVSGVPGSLETSLSHRCRSISTSQITPSPSESCGMVFRGREKPWEGATGPRSSGSSMSTLTGHDALCAISGDACVLRVSRLRSDDRSPAARPREAVSGPLAPDDPHLPPTVFPLSESHQGRVVNKVRMRFVGGSPYGDRPSGFGSILVAGFGVPGHSWSILVGAGLIGLFVFGAFDGSQPPNAPDDPGLGLGAMLVTAALTPILAALLWLGGGIGILFRRMRS
jgi:hypothetical protein